MRSCKPRFYMRPPWVGSIFREPKKFPNQKSCESRPARIGRKEVGSDVEQSCKMTQNIYRKSPTYLKPTRGRAFVSLARFLAHHGIRESAFSTFYPAVGGFFFRFGKTVQAC